MELSPLAGFLKTKNRSLLYYDFWMEDCIEILKIGPKEAN